MIICVFYGIFNLASRLKILFVFIILEDAKSKYLNTISVRRNFTSSFLSFEQELLGDIKALVNVLETKCSFLDLDERGGIK